jgi:serine/threonine-protein phosphatase 2B regulatory subunit
MFIALFVFQRLLRMLDGLNFKEFLAFLSAFSPRATLQQKVQYNVVTTHFCYSFVKPYF